MKIRLERINRAFSSLVLFMGLTGCMTGKMLQDSKEQFEKGNVFTGLYLGTVGVTVAGITDVVSLGGTLSPEEAAGAATAAAGRAPDESYAEAYVNHAATIKANTSQPSDKDDDDALLSEALKATTAIAKEGQKKAATKREQEAARKKAQEEANQIRQQQIAEQKTAFERRKQEQLEKARREQQLQQENHQLRIEQQRMEQQAAAAAQRLEREQQRAALLEQQRLREQQRRIAQQNQRQTESSSPEMVNISFTDRDAVICNDRADQSSCYYRVFVRNNSRFRIRCTADVTMERPTIDRTIRATARDTQEVPSGGESTISSNRAVRGEYRVFCEKA